jgi:hypothetical protein
MPVYVSAQAHKHTYAEDALRHCLTWGDAFNLH